MTSIVRDRRTHAQTYRGRRHVLKTNTPSPPHRSDIELGPMEEDMNGSGGGDGGCRCCDNWIGAQECGKSPDDRPTDRPNDRPPASRTIKWRRRLFGNVARRQVTRRGWPAHNRSPPETIAHTHDDDACCWSASGDQHV